MSKDTGKLFDYAVIEHVTTNRGGMYGSFTFDIEVNSPVATTVSISWLMMACDALLQHDEAQGIRMKIACLFSVSIPWSYLPFTF